jgi:hypothetical protein
MNLGTAITGTVTANPATEDVVKRLANDALSGARPSVKATKRLF